MEIWSQVVIPTLAVVLGGATGFWGYMSQRDKAKTASNKLMMGIAYKTLTTLGVSYIDRGWITKDEFEEYQKYYYEPYKALGGNGVAELIMSRVMSLPFSSKSKYDEILKNDKTEEFINNVRVLPQPAPAE